MSLLGLFMEGFFEEVVVEFRLKFGRGMIYG